MEPAPSLLVSCCQHLTVERAGKATGPLGFGCLNDETDNCNPLVKSAKTRKICLICETTKLACTASLCYVVATYTAGDRMLSAIPNTISYDILLLELATRLVSGELPEDSKYFAELMFNLEANRCSLERRIFKQGQQRELV